MSDVKKDHSIGAGTGAVAGAVTGAAVGSAAGPVGTVVGGVVGGVVGAKAGDSIAEAVNPTEYSEHFKNTYRERPYFSKEREWSDYEPAYKYGYDTYGQYRGQRFDDVEGDRSATGTRPARSRGWSGTRPRVPCAMAGTTSSTSSRATSTATVADPRDASAARPSRRTPGGPPRAALPSFGAARMAAPQFTEAERGAG
jgi:hypothetical protein